MMEGNRANRAAAPLTCFVENRAAAWWRGYANGRNGGSRPHHTASLEEYLGHDMGAHHRAREAAAEAAQPVPPLFSSAHFKAIKREIAAVERSDTLFATAALWVPGRT